jgi:ADP-ribose pyrophosphatase YjhB (NUDIX family)
MVPIVCVDALPFRREDDALEIGMIWRDDGSPPERGWALVGGAIRRGESITDALSRHLVETLGPDTRWALPDDGTPARVDQYFPRPREGGHVDPRKHAIALTYAVPYLGGELHPAGEAESFRWFALDAVPGGDEGAYGHLEVVAQILSRDERFTDQVNVR